MPTTYVIFWTYRAYRETVTRPSAERFGSWTEAWAHAETVLDALPTFQARCLSYTIDPAR